MRDRVIDRASKDSTTVRIWSVLFFVAVAFFVGFTLTGGWDIWWHMLVGRVFWSGGFSVLESDVFSHTTGNAAWLHKDLLADIILYFGFNKLGFAWFAVLKGTTIIAVVFGINNILPSKTRRAGYTLLVGGLAVVAIQYRLVERPILFSMALFPILMATLEAARRRSLESFVLRGSIYSWLPSVLLVWLWAWLHRGAMVGLALILAYAFERWMALLTKRYAPFLFGPVGHIGHAVVATIAFAVSAVLLLFTPSGVHFYTSSFAVAGNETLRGMISDWAPLGIVDLATHFPVTCVLFFLAAFCVGRLLFMNIRSRSGAYAVTPGVMHAVLLLMFAWAAVFDSVRWVPQLSLFSALILMLVLPELSEVFLPSKLARARGRKILLAVAIGAIIWLNNSFMLGVGEVPGKFPHGAVVFAKEHNLSGKVINSFHLGGFILWEMWPDVLVSADGRNDLVYSPKLLIKLLRSQSNLRLFKQLAGQSGVKWVMASNVPGHLSHKFLFKDPKWMMVYWSESAVIYVKRENFPKSEYPALWEGEFKVINPTVVDVSIINAIQNRPYAPSVFEQMKVELDMMLASAPDGLRSNVALAVYYNFMGQRYFAERDAVMQKLTRIHKDSDAVKELEKRFKTNN